MATSGNFLTSDSGQGGGNFYGRTIFEWWRTGWGRSGGVGYHNISFTHKTYGGSSSYYQKFYQGSMNVDGAGYGYPSPITAYGAGVTTLGSGSKTLYTNSAGNRWFSASAQGGIVWNTINTSGSGGWDLDNIPMHASLTALSMDTGGIAATDEGPMWLEFSNPAGGSVDAFIEVGGTRIFTSPGWQSSRYNFPFNTGLKEALQNATPNSNTATLRVGIHDAIGGTDIWDYRDRGYQIKNDYGQANPTFSNFTYADTNSTTASITGNDQILIQGKSTLQTTVSVANKATANKGASMSSYTFSIGSYSQGSSWSSSSNVVKNIGTISDVTGAHNLSVKAIDSRGNFKTVTKSVTIIPYSSPAFVPTLSINYTNNYDNTNGLTVTADGTKIAGVSPITITSVDKNSVNGASGVQFDMSKSNNSSYTGSWVNVATSFGANTGNITTTLSTLQTAILNKMNSLTADNTVKWYIKFKITDALETRYYETYIDIGKTIFRIGTDGYVYNNEVKLATVATPTKHIVGGTDEPAYQNSWTQYTSPWLPSYFFKTSDGVVTLSVMTKSGTLNSTIFTLPSGYRPSGIVSCAGQDSAGAVLVKVNSDGTVATEAGSSNSWLAFNLSFLAEQ